MGSPQWAHFVPLSLLRGHLANGGDSVGSGWYAPCTAGWILMLTHWHMGAVPSPPTVSCYVGALDAGWLESC